MIPSLSATNQLFLLKIQNLFSLVSILPIRRESSALISMSCSLEQWMMMMMRAMPNTRRGAGSSGGNCF